jgi:MFS transporter, DHA3 family, macrolide efflux protein
VSVETTASERDASRAMGWPHTFLLLWAGQSVSLIGSGLTAFALAVYVYRTTGSVTQFSLLNLCIYVPGILVPPLSGALADRYSRKWLMIAANAGGALTTVLLTVLATAGTLNVALVYVVTVLFRVFAVTLSPATTASVSQLVPERHLSRANGVVEIALSLSQLLSPPLGGLFLLVLGLRGIVLVDFVTFLVAILTLLPLTIPQPEAESGKGTLLDIPREATEGLRQLLPRPGLMGVLLYMAAFNVAAGFTLALAAPLVLSTESTQVFGFISGASGVGLLTGSALMAVWQGPKRRVDGLLAVGIGAGLVMALPALGHSETAYVVWMFGLPVLATIGNVLVVVIWQTRIPAHLQGRVIGSMATITLSFMLLSFVVAGPLVDNVLEPLLKPGGGLAGTVGLVTGTGPGRGIALALLIGGLFPLVAALVGFRSRAVREVENTPWEGGRPAVVEGAKA